MASKQCDRKTAFHRELSVSVGDCCSIPLAATETAASSWRRDVSSLSPPLPLSSAFDLPLSSFFSPLLRLFRIVLLCPSGTPFPLLCHCRCACLYRSHRLSCCSFFGAGDHFKRQPTFLVVPIVIYYTIQFLLKAGNAILPFDGANRICVCMFGWGSVGETFYFK